MNSHRSRHLRQASDGFFHVAGIKHHQVRQLVNDDDDVGNRLLIAAFGKQARSIAVVKQAIVLINISDTFFREKLQAAFHLADGIAQGIGCQLRLSDDWCVKVRHAFVVAQFKPFGIHEHEANLIGRGLVQDGHDHCVDSHALAGSG